MKKKALFQRRFGGRLPQRGNTCSKISRRKEKGGGKWIKINDDTHSMK